MATPTVLATPTPRNPVRWMFESRRTGRIVIAQWPNVPLALFLVATVVLAAAHPHGSIHTWLHVLAVVSLVVWAVDEITRGVNPFRRGFGAVVLLAELAMVFGSATLH